MAQVKCTGNLAKWDTETRECMDTQDQRTAHRQGCTVRPDILDMDSMEFQIRISWDHFGLVSNTTHKSTLGTLTSLLVSSLL